PPDFILDASDDTWRWKGFLNVLQLPYIYNPATGFVASANNKPAEAPVPVGRFFSADDRIVRIKQMLAAKAKHAIADMKAIQLDVYMVSSVAVRNAIVRRVDELGLAPQLSADGAKALALMRGWDGHYRAEDRGPVAFELVYKHFSQYLAERKVGEEFAEAYGGFSRIKRMLVEDFAALDDGAAAAMLRKAFEAAGERLGTFATWGDMHRLSLGHPLSFVPLIGDRYRFGDHPADGSSDTLMKTAHSPSDERHDTRYGQQARHLSDLADMDDNRFLLLGGQDGWFNSSTALDQVPMWRRGDYIRLPMRAESVKAWRARAMRLKP
ncbi:MAG: penicillin acylase family protein, partial [Rhodospirillaceae bacterium]|nr:penicillin acylase family protein [Rhodospirillaceae bacterium]